MAANINELTDWWLSKYNSKVGNDDNDLVSYVSFNGIEVFQDHGRVIMEGLCNEVLYSYECLITGSQEVMTPDKAHSSTKYFWFFFF